VENIEDSGLIELVEQEGVTKLNVIKDIGTMSEHMSVTANNAIEN